MRTTVTLDADVERLIKDAMRERGISFKDALNQAVRKGLIADKPASNRKFVQKSFPLGSGLDFRWDKALAMAEAMEDEDITRKLSVRK